MNKDRIKGIAAIGALVIVMGGGAIGLAAWDSSRTTVEPEPTSTVSVASFYESNGFAEAPERPTPEPVAVVAPPVAEPAPAPEPAQPSPGASGTQVPFIPSSDPNNANGGDYIDPGVYCFSGSASTVGGVPVCD